MPRIWHAHHWNCAPLGSHNRLKGDHDMLTVGLFARLEAKPGKEEEVAAFLEQGLQLANQESTTPLWFALRFGPSSFAIFDAFREESGRQAHLNGPIAQALMARAPALLASPPAIERLDVLGAKLPG
jgi:quinol monooxygenase YgiN